MNKDFTLTLDSDLFTLEFSTNENKKKVNLYAEFRYSDECPTYGFETELAPDETQRIMPDKAAAMFSLIANLATQDIEAEAEFEELVKETVSEGVSYEDVPIYDSCFEKCYMHW